MEQDINRRGVLGAFLGATLASRFMATMAQSGPMNFCYPVGNPGDVFGNGFLIRHGYATENTWYLPGYLHTGEDWYTAEGDAAGAGVYAVAAGEVVFAGSEYPGLVVILQHPGDLYSMYGHLDYALAVQVGDVVERGQRLGAILARTDGRAPSHLHFEIRTFFTTPEVNGDAPRYGFACGFECPPGPGYWPIDAPEHPSVMGWRNPTHVIANRSFDDAPPDDAEVIVASLAGDSAALWSAPSDDANAGQVGDLPLAGGDRYRLLDIATGPETSEATSAAGYRLWYRIAVPDVGRVWVQAAIPSANDTGSDGLPSSVRFDFLPAISPD